MGAIENSRAFRWRNWFSTSRCVCDRYIEKRSRTRDQMVQAARSGVQNIAEGSQASGTSKKTELKLTNVARASLEELRLDYEDFLRQRGLPLWDRDDPRRQSLIDRRCATADEVAVWVREEHDCGHGGHSGQGGQGGLGGQGGHKEPSTPTYPELAANAALVLLAVACSLLDRQLAAQAAAFEIEVALPNASIPRSFRKTLIALFVHSVYQAHPVRYRLRSPKAR